VLGLALPVHHCETHGPWHKNIVVVSTVVLTTIWRLHEVILVRRALLDGLKVLILGVFAAVIRHIPSVLRLNTAFLIVAVEVLDVEGSASLVIAQLGCGTWLKGLVLCTSSALGVQMLP
jgi:hypothetical protein